MGEKNVWRLGLVVLSVLVCSLSWFWSDSGGKEGQEELQSITISSPKTQAMIKVYVSGAVKEPGIYEVPKGCRAKEAIDRAGGLTAVANRDRVNLARICRDGTQINVPKLSSKQLKELFASGQLNNQNTPGPEEAARLITENQGKIIRRAEAAQDTSPKGLGPVNINRADAEELTNLPGVGKATAMRIIEYRNKKPFTSREELMKVPGIGKAKYEKLKNYLTL